MPIADEIMPYTDALAALGDGRKHVLLGNGFSIACDPIFSYASLYEAAVAKGLSDRAQAVFGLLGTNNFEGVMNLLERSHWVAQIYGLIEADGSPMLDDAAIVKQTLVEAVAGSHLAHTGLVADEKKAAALNFLRPFHNIFTTNYDLLAYWVVMSSPDGPRWQDGFRSDEDDPDTPYVVFAERLGGQRGLFYLHGALHLHVVHGELRKHTWIRTGRPLTELIQESLAKNEYPLFVAEGEPSQKLEQIQRTGYLWYCLDKLARIQGPLVIFGHSLGPSDQHIVDIITENTDLPHIAIGVHGDPSSPGNQAIHASAEAMRARRATLVDKRGRGQQLHVSYFQSESAQVWG
jgi:hypothetical protein